MVEIEHILKVWDIGGQEQFKFAYGMNIKTDSPLPIRVNKEKIPLPQVFLDTNSPMVDIKSNAYINENNGEFSSNNYSNIRGSNLILVVIDPKRYRTSVKYISSILPHIQGYNRIYVATKKDLIHDEDEGTEVKNLEKMLDEEFVWVSNKSGENIENLRSKIISVISQEGNYMPRNVEHTLRESKVVISGEGGAGKSALYNQLKDNSFSKTSLTIGFNIGALRFFYNE